MEEPPDETRGGGAVTLGGAAVTFGVAVILGRVEFASTVVVTVATHQRRVIKAFIFYVLNNIKKIKITIKIMILGKS